VEDSAGIWRAIKSLSSQERFDLIEVPDYFGLGFWGTANRFRRVPIMVRSHGYLDLTLPHLNWAGASFQFALERFSVRQADFVLAASSERVLHYQATFGVLPTRIASLVYGIDALGFAQDSPATHTRNYTSILYLGRVELRKGCDLLLDALRTVHRAEPRTQVTFIGSVADDMAEDFSAFLQSESSWVRHLGAIAKEQVGQHMAQHDMIVLPSRFETLPRVLIEALAVGIPQVATPVNGIPEIVEHDVTGLLVEPENPHALAEAMLKLAAAPETRAKMSFRSRQRAMEKFDISRVMRSYVHVVRALVEGRSPHSVLDQAV
jgi:glycosyltransferase involved in cell wall biosynthesis